jgi:diguanylate cyclase (GGDEF)-like protein
MERRRLAALQRLGLLDTPPEERFERLTRIARTYYNAASSFFSLVDSDRQWLKSAQGLEIEETDRGIAFCDYAIKQDAMLVVEDATKDPRFCNNPLVTGDPKIRFYAGVPVREPGGFKVGSFCITDDKPRKRSSLDMSVLRDLASIVEDELEKSMLGSSPTDFVEVSALGRSIQRAQNIYLTSDNKNLAFELMLEDFLLLTGSQFGFIVEIHKYKATNQPSLKVGAITNIALDPDREALYQQFKRQGLIFDRTDTATGLPMMTDEVVFSNEPLQNARRAGAPNGAASLECYIAIPVYSGDQYVGLIGLANRESGYTSELAEELAPLVQTLGTLIDRNQLYSEKQVHQERLEQAANYDELTGLPNRRRLTELFKQELVEVIEREGSMSVCFLDLDGFKEINDEHGHSVGDAVLKSVADRLTAVLRDEDIVSRLGGDEFVAILRDVPDERIYGRILEAISNPITYKGFVLNISGSMGVAVYPDDNSDPDLLIRHADQAMYAAKDSGKNCFKIFDVKVHQTRKRKINLLEQLDLALSGNQLEMYFQPKIDLEKQRVDGFEALIRWNHPDEGLLAPAQFLEHLEYTEYAAAVGRFVMADGARKLSQIMEQNLPYSISINLSPSHFLGRQFISDLAQALESIPFEQRNRLVIEVLETTALDEATKVISKLQKCKELGVRVSLDDFGTGFSSLDHFRRLPADEIKIDKSFVMDMLTDREDEVIVDAIIGLSSSFSRKVIAEGVENAQTAARLMDLGCQFAQGFFYSRPQPFEDALVWASTFSWSNYEPAR